MAQLGRILIGLYLAVAVTLIGAVSVLQLNEHSHRQCRAAAPKSTAAAGCSAAHRK